MNEIKQYVAFNPGLIMKTHYLTEPMAYFLGGIYASEEQVISSDGKYKIAPVRYNYNAATNLEIAQHYELVKKNCTACKWSDIHGRKYKRHRVGFWKKPYAGI